MMTIPSFWIRWAVVMMIFWMPISTSLQNISLGIMMVLISLDRSMRQMILALCRKPWCIALMMLGIFAIFASIWSVAEKVDIIGVLGKYIKLMYLPCFVAAFHDVKTRQFSKHAFIVAMMITCILSFLKKMGICHYHGEDSGFVFRNHIITGYMMSMAAFICVLSITSQQRRLYRMLYALCALLFSIQILFINMGRATYVIYAVLGIIWVWRTCSGRQNIMALGGLLLAFIVIFSQSTLMQDRWHAAFEDWHHYHTHTNMDTPFGFRLQFYTFTWSQFRTHPWLGLGTGGLNQAFHDKNPVPHWHKDFFEPHQQYLFMLSEWGIIGFSFFVSLILLLMLEKIDDPVSDLLRVGTLASFLVGCLSDSLLFYSSTGLFFLVWMAVALGSTCSTVTSVCQGGECYGRA